MPGYLAFAQKNAFFILHVLRARSGFAISNSSSTKVDCERASTSHSGPCPGVSISWISGYKQAQHTWILVNLSPNQAAYTMAHLPRPPPCREMQQHIRPQPTAVSDGAPTSPSGSRPAGRGEELRRRSTGNISLTLLTRSGGIKILVVGRHLKAHMVI